MKRNIKRHLIAHYTSDIGFNSIISSGKLWFTDIYYLNDYNERHLYIKRLFERYGYSKFFSDFPIELRNILEEYLDGFIDRFLKSKRCFVLSCSSLKDNLAMWNYYSKNSFQGGYNITFQPLKLCNSIASNLELKSCSSVLYYGEVFYKNNLLNDILDYCNAVVDKEFDETIKFFPNLSNVDINPSNCSLAQEFFSDSEKCNRALRETFEQLNPFYKKFFPSLAKLEDNLCLSSSPYSVLKFSNDKILNEVFSLDCFYKNKSFSFEKESRFVIQIDNSHIPQLIRKGIYKTRVSNGLIVPYLEVPYDKESIKEVYIAPTNFLKNCEESTESFLREFGVEAIVKKSEISVRF